MKIKAHFSWSAPRDLFFLRPPRGTSAEICQMIEADARQTLRDHPGLEALEDYYNLSGATVISLGDKPLPQFDHTQDEPGSDLYCLDVYVEGELGSERGWREMATWAPSEVWDEIYRCGDITGDASRFRVLARSVS